MPTQFDPSDLEARINAVGGMIPSVPAPLDISPLESKLKELDDELQVVKQQKGGRRGGGHTDMGVQYSMGRIVKTETPSGAIDGVNTAYTLTQPIHAVLSYQINGETIASSNYSIAGNKITWTTAIPAAYAGLDHEIIYV